jgi:CRP-like cAMP-binding protein
MTTNESTDIIRKLFTRGQPLYFSKGDIVIGNEAAPNGVYFIGTGYIKAYSISDDGDEYIHLIFGHRELFPLIWAYLGNVPEAVYYEALSDCTLWRISRDWFNTFIQTDLSISAAIGQQLAQQFQIFSDRIDNLEYKKASERVAYRLLFLASRFGIKTHDNILIDAPITHDIFANSVNLARETVSRQLELLEKQHILGRENNHFVIEDLSALVSKLSRPPNFLNWRLGID